MLVTTTGVDISCEEVCVCCFKVFRVISEFIRHTRQHSDANQTKKSYMVKICFELRKLSDSELRRLLPHATRGNAKRRTTKGSDLTPQARDDLLQLESYAEPAENYLNGGSNVLYCPASPSSTKNRDPVCLPKSSDASLSRINQANPPVNLPTDSYQPLVDDAIYDPPLFMRLNFPEYPSWVDESTWLPRLPESIPALQLEQ